MNNNIFEHYEAFYNMLLSVTMLSNTTNAEVTADGCKIVKLFGEAYNLGSDLVKECEVAIFDKLASLALIGDSIAMYNTIEHSQSFTADDVLADLKADVLKEIHNIGRKYDVGPFDYSHYNVYEPHIRFAEIRNASVGGNVQTTRQVGIMKLLGVGCEQNLPEAISRLFQCTMWGDIPAIYLLAYAHKLAGDQEKSRLFFELAELCTNYLYSGVTVLPQAEKARHSEEACTYYVYVSTILQDVSLAYNLPNVDFSFVEAITSDALDYFERMNYINNYDKKEWKNVTNSAVKPKKAIGFR